MRVDKYRCSECGKQAGYCLVIGYVLHPDVNPLTTMKYCPFTGERLTDEKKA